MPLTERTFTVSYKRSSLKATSLFREQSSDYLLCLHGIQSNKEVFLPFLKQEFLNNFSVIALDYIGFGNSSKPEDFSYDVEDQAYVIIEIIEQLRIKKLYIIGHSLGGVIGTLLLQPLQGSVRSFINMEGSLILTNSELSKTVAEYSFDEFRNKKYMQIQNDLQHSTEPSASWRAQWLKHIPDYVFYRTYVSLRDWAKSGRLLKLFAQAPCKKAYMIGDKNISKKDIVPQGIQTIVIAQAGHSMLIDNPKVCFSAINTFFKNAD